MSALPLPGLTPVGVVHAPFKEKFGIPRQSGLAKDVSSTLELLPPYNVPEAVTGLDGFSHLWLIFGFHATAERGWRPTVRPPRLGGNRRVGVFASRSTHRPNPLGLSVVELTGIDTRSGVVLHLRGADLMDGTPVFDIKPYIAFADAIPTARSGYVDAPPAVQPVSYTPAAQQQLAQHQQRWPQLSQVIQTALGYDPRPAYKNTTDADYGVHLYDVNVRWTVAGEQVVVTEISPVSPR
ncbi:tRNA (N6-threonylcarbamoyladenosine(37)-N6)-methyltransferase TrmO [Leeia oryzae]|uniref:tRNA (N6-threonylcarbamoyladenosine(37)-N6)-methyltransferase TrmO n=1 Tax=Leeia oryzae TaxID=356662 RepID=UPI000373E387|nr:tRNA (N6-threonylcarbamoyladenosine(37)-N6)-methyltransferase TrmO [Leeia oryzae]